MISNNIYPQNIDENRSSRNQIASEENMNKEEDNQNGTIDYLTIHQILSSTWKNGEIKINGKRIYNMVLMGQVIDLDKTKKHLQIELDDGTGSIIVTVYDRRINHLTNRDCDRLINQYVRVIGHVNHYVNPVSIKCYKLKTILDHNEITSHILMVIRWHVSNRIHRKNKEVGNTNSKDGIVNKKNETHNQLLPKLFQNINNINNYLQTKNTIPKTPLSSNLKLVNNDQIIEQQNLDQEIGKYESSYLKAPLQNSNIKKNINYNIKPINHHLYLKVNDNNHNRNSLFPFNNVENIN
ncbi:replication protein a-related [Anaeramoeba flamelloides]|uniref:Replication protein a-related n=1 Tax=Anaeramoeba flamelloides TaxID=1746091 RepID=A0ABQ8YE14_9EUKA|nr:replication protein a-related [Anaeramoeba flamelloides]